MNDHPRIVITRGPLNGRVILLDNTKSLSIGRGATNDLDISHDLAISRDQHCSIRPSTDSFGQFEIVDGQNTNGTFVNDERISRQALIDGDRISIGGTVLVFLSDEDAPEDLVDEELSQYPSTVEWSAQEVKKIESARDITLPESRLAALLSFAGVVHGAGDVRAVQYRALEFLSTELPCDGGAAVVKKGGSPSAVWWNRHLGPCTAQPISRTISRRVTEDGVAILSRDTASDHEFRNVLSVMREGTRSLMATPLVVERGILGMIYLQSATADAFSVDDLRFLTVAGGVAARAIENLLQRLDLEQENRELQKELGAGQAIVGDSPGIKNVQNLISKYARADCSVLILGQSGTGKELAARAIHNESPRSRHPFVAVNCAVLTDTLFESDLFGHEKGAFTGAVVRREGKLERAEQGTLFLDEVGELAPQAQAKLLRVLQEREFERVGGTRTLRADVRVLAATNRDLRKLCEEGQFREDLYYRLNVVSLTMPPLRSRLGDIPKIARFWIERSGARSPLIRGFSLQAEKCLMNYSWPGNVRELINVIERAIVMGASEWILPEHLPEEIVGLSEAASASRYMDGVRRAKLNLVRQGLEEANGDRREAARILGIDVTYLYRLIKSLNIA